MLHDPGLTDPGSSTYASNTLHVGDGTWDSGRDTFLLPNLMGVNFETMRYNGMGNRFREMAGYQTLIIVHGIIAAVVFLGLVPISVLIVRYYSRWNPYWAFKLHVWFQVLTLLLTTVVFVMGYFAVGPKRSLTNPHHGIGLAIYVIVIFQTFWGYMVHKVESKRKRYHVPLKLVIHRWLGRALVILGFVQIPLGLTLYGSPKSLFILYSIGAFAYLAVLFVLSYLYDTEGYHRSNDLDSRIPGRPPHGSGHHNLGRIAAAGTAGLGLAELLGRRHRRKNRNEAYDDSQSSYLDDKRTEDESDNSWWRVLLKIGAIIGIIALLKKVFRRKHDRESDAESGRYRPAHTRSNSMADGSFSRMEDGRRPEPSYIPSGRPQGRPVTVLSQTQSPDSLYYDSEYLTDDGGRSHGIRNALLGAGAFAAAKKIFSRRNNDEQRRVEEMRRRDREDERLARANSKRRNTGGVHSGPYRRAASYTATEMSSDAAHHSHGPPYGEPVASGAVGGAVDGAHSDMLRIPSGRQNTASDVTGQRPPEHGADELGAGTALMAESAAGQASTHNRPHSSNENRREQAELPASPPVSVRVKVHNDGRHVTLRRLTEEEAAASRDSRRRDRRSSRRRARSASSFSGNEGSSDRWRRVEELERQQAEQIRRQQEAAAAAATANNSAVQPGSLLASPFPTQPQMNAPPPPVPQLPSSLPYGSLTSPGTWTGTDASGDYANNRRRRRAERARAKQERQGHGVEFT